MPLLKAKERFHFYSNFFAVVFIVIMTNSLLVDRQLAHCSTVATDWTGLTPEQVASTPLPIKQTTICEAPGLKNLTLTIDSQNKGSENSSTLTAFHSEIILIRYRALNVPILWNDCLLNGTVLCPDLYNCYAGLVQDVCVSIAQCSQSQVKAMTPRAAPNVLVDAVFYFESGTTVFEVSSALEDAFVNLLEIDVLINILSLCENCGSGTLCLFETEKTAVCIFYWVLYVVIYALLALVIAFLTIVCACVNYRRKRRNKKAADTQQQPDSPQTPQVVSPTNDQQLAIANPALALYPFSPYSPPDREPVNISELIPRVNGPPLPRLSRITHLFPLPTWSPTAENVNMAYFESDTGLSTTSSSSNNYYYDDRHLEATTAATQRSSAADFDDNDVLTKSERRSRNQMRSRSLREPHVANTSRHAYTIGRTDLSRPPPGDPSLPTEILPHLPRPYHSSDPSARNITELFKQIQSEYDEI